MSYTTKAFLSVILLFSSLYVFGQEEPSLLTDFKSLYFVEEVFDESYDGAPGLFIFMLLMLIFILVCIGIGVLIAAILLLVLFGIIAAGLISSSVLVGLYNRSFLKGFKIFIIGSSTVGCLILGTVCFIIYNEIVHYWTLKTAIFAGILCGSIAGFLLGIVLSYTVQKLTGYFHSKLKVKLIQ